MSELLDNSKFRKKKLKELILLLHKGESPDKIRKELIATLEKIPYGEVVEVEQSLIEEGLPAEEVLRLCDIHGEVLKGNVDLSDARSVPEGHPVDVFARENMELVKVCDRATGILRSIEQETDIDFDQTLLQLTGCFNELMDVDKHYQRKEYLVFPYLEKNEITGPPKVMWGKHDEIREQLKACIEILNMKDVGLEQIRDSLELIFYPVLKAVVDMVQKEEEILFPMCLDVLTTEDWWSVHRQTLEFGFTLYDPSVDWQPEGIVIEDAGEAAATGDGSIQLPSGKFTAAELMAILNTVPFDMTFVDKDDRVKYFTQGEHRIFPRSRSILNRDVRLCHPPGSVHIVEKILEDFKSGKASHAPFWIQMKGKFIHIEYFALRDENGGYLGTLEVSQDLSDLRKLEGEQRILSYSGENTVNHG
jgi:DUF438 domain-containing protein